MTLPTNPIDLDTAKVIFANVNFATVRVGGKEGVVGGYIATIEGFVYENNDLATLCQILWNDRKRKYTFDDRERQTANGTDITGTISRKLKELDPEGSVKYGSTDRKPSDIEDS